MVAPKTISPRPSTPLSLKGNFPLVADKKIEQIVFGGFPQNIIFFLKQFPELRKTLSELGVNKVRDMFKIANVRFALPAVSELREITLPADVPIVELSSAEQKKISTGVMFVRAPNETKGIIDINTVLVFDGKGKPRQLVNVVAGAEIKLIVKTDPDKPVDRVDGYVTYSKKELVEAPRLPTQSLVASIVLAQESLIQPLNDGKKKLLLKKFPYADIRKNGIFSANVTMPKVSGTYGIATIITYKDKRLAAQNIDLTAVVSPEGYVYEQTARGALLIKEAKITLYQCDSSHACAPWEAEKYQQSNTVVTGGDGSYSFLTPPGQYYVKVEAKGYEPYQSELFIISNDNFVKVNIELKAQPLWKKLLMLY